MPPFDFSDETHEYINNIILDRTYQALITFDNHLSTIDHLRNLCAICETYYH